MENTEGDLASGQASETTTQNNNSVTESSSSSASVQESTMVTLLKTMQEQLQVSNQLLFGLFSETKRPLSRKRKISVSDSDDEESFSLESRPPRGKITRTESATISVAPHRQKKPSVINEPSSATSQPPTDISFGVHQSGPGDNMHQNSPDPSQQQPVDDDVLSLYGDHDIDQADHRVNRKNDDPNDPESDADQGQANLQNKCDQQGHEELISSDVFLESIDSSTSITVLKGPPVSANLATLINTRFKTELETGQRKQIKAKYLVPENCTDLFWPPVNEHIWNPLKPDVKGADRALVAMQDTLVTVSGAVATCLNDLLLSRDKTKLLDYKAFSTRLIDVVTLLGSVCRELSYRRKEALRPYINADFKFACNRSTKPDKFLFGNDISKTMQEVKTMGKIVQKFPQKARGGPQFRGSAQKQQNKTYGQPFLSQRGRATYPPRRNQGQFSSGQQNKKKSWNNWNK